MYDVTNVAVVDPSCFPTGPEKNPTLTAMALAARAADRLADDLRDGVSAVSRRDAGTAVRSAGRVASRARTARAQLRARFRGVGERRRLSGEHRHGRIHEVGQPSLLLA